MLRRTYDWTMSLAGHRHALAALALVAFAESSFFPIPPDILIIPMVLAAPQRAWRVAAVATAASVLGGLFGYLIGAGLYDSLGQPMLAFYGYEQRRDRAQPAGLHGRLGGLARPALPAQALPTLLRTKTAT